MSNRVINEDILRGIVAALERHAPHLVSTIHNVIRAGLADGPTGQIGKSVHGKLTGGISWEFGEPVLRALEAIEREHGYHSPKIMHFYIGKAGHEGRLATLLMSVAPRYRGAGHSFGIRYKVDERFLQRFPDSHLIIQLIPTNDPDAQESQLIEEYEAKFGELPPFNHSKRKRHYTTPASNKSLLLPSN